MPPPAPSSALPGRIHGFSFIKFLGKGTFGAVYQARTDWQNLPTDCLTVRSTPRSGPRSGTRAKRALEKKSRFDPALRNENGCRLSGRFAAESRDGGKSRCFAAAASRQSEPLLRSAASRHLII